MSSSESLAPVSAEKKKDPIMNALESVGVRSRTRQNEIRREIGKCELSVRALHESAPKNSSGEVSLGAQKQLEQDISYLILESQNKILEMINRGRSGEPLKEVPSAIYDKLGRFSETDEELAELARVREEMLRAESKRRSVSVENEDSETGTKSDALKGKAQVADSSRVGDNGKTTMSTEGVPKSDAGEHKNEREALISIGPLKFKQEDINEILAVIDHNRAARGLIIRRSGGVDQMTGGAKAQFENSYQRARQVVLRMAQDANRASGRVTKIPSEWEARLNGYDLPQGPVLPSKSTESNSNIKQERMNTERERFEGVAADFVQYTPDSEEVDVPPIPKSRSRKGALGEVVGAIDKDLGGKGDAENGKGKKEPAKKKSGGAEVAGSDRLARAEEWEEELEQGKKAKKQSAEGEPLTPESAQENPDFKRFMLAYFPDGDAGEVAPERLAAHVEMFNRFQETIGQTADIFIGLLEKDGVVRVSQETRKEFISDIGVFMLKNARNQPMLLEGLQTSIQNVKEAQPRIAEKEKQLAELGSRDELIAKRDALVQAKDRKSKLEGDYGKGPVRSFMRGFLDGFNTRVEVVGISVGAVGEMGELSPTLERSEKRPSFFKRLALGWRSGAEAKLKSKEAEDGLKSPELASIEEALQGGALQQLEDKIRTIEDADREKQRMTVAFDQARELIFEGIGQLSGVTNRIKEMAQKQIEVMRAGDGGLAFLQDSYERLERARERSKGDSDIGYVSEQTIETTLSQVDSLMKLEFMERIHDAMTTEATGEGAYDAMRESLGKYARLEKLGSRHGAEVRELFRDTVKVLSKREGVTPEQRLRMSFFLGALRAESNAPESINAHAQESEHAPSEPHAEATHHDESKPEKTAIPKKGDLITFYGKVNEKDGYKTFKDFRIESFKYKGEVPSPDTDMVVVGYDTDKKGKRIPLRLTLRYGDYVASQKTKAEKHA